MKEGRKTSSLALPSSTGSSPQRTQRKDSAGFRSLPKSGRICIPLKREAKKSSGCRWKWWGGDGSLGGEVVWGLEEKVQDWRMKHRTYGTYRTYSTYDYRWG